MKFSITTTAILVLALAACGEEKQAADNGIAADQGYSVENSAANDVTAIDAATADAAGMAADAEANLALPELENESGNNSAADAASNRD